MAAMVASMPQFGPQHHAAAIYGYHDAGSYAQPFHSPPPFSHPTPARHYPIHGNGTPEYQNSPMPSPTLYQQPQPHQRPDYRHSRHSSRRSLSSQQQAVSPNPQTSPQLPDSSVPYVDPAMYVSLDAEFVGTGLRGLTSALARVSICDFYDNVLLDTFCRPSETVTDYRSWVSGVRAADLEAAPSIEVVRGQVQAAIRGKILVGHAVFNDLAVLGLDHPKQFTRDTATFVPLHVIANSQTPSLRALARLVLKVDTFQIGEHSSIEDARMTMAIFKVHRQAWEHALLFPPAKPIIDHSGFLNHPFASNSAPPSVAKTMAMAQTKTEITTPGNRSQTMGSSPSNLKPSTPSFSPRQFASPVSESRRHLDVSSSPAPSKRLGVDVSPLLVSDVSKDDTPDEMLSFSGVQSFLVTTESGDRSLKPRVNLPSPSPPRQASIPLSAIVMGKRATPEMVKTEMSKGQTPEPVANSSKTASTYTPALDPRFSAASSLLPPLKTRNSAVSPDAASSTSALLRKRSLEGKTARKSSDNLPLDFGHKASSSHSSGSTNASSRSRQSTSSSLNTSVSSGVHSPVRKARQLSGATRSNADADTAWRETAKAKQQLRILDSNGTLSPEQTLPSSFGKLQLNSVVLDSHTSGGDDTTFTTFTNKRRQKRPTS